MDGPCTEKNKVDMLNVLRVIAFLCVFFLHTKIFIPIHWNENVSWSWLLYTPAWAGVWIFIMLAGYGIGRGFYSGKYEISVNGIIRYWIRRISKIVPLYWFYILVVSIFISPSILVLTKENFFHLLSLFFFNYQEEFGNLEYGLSWYLTTVMRLYIIAPFVFILLKRVEKYLAASWLFLLFLVGGAVARVSMGYHISFTGGIWDLDIYQPFYFNLDLFFCGFLLGNLERGKQRRWGSFTKAAVVAVLLGVILVNSKIYYEGNYNGNNVFYMNIYRYVLPTVYCIVTGLYIYIFEICRTYSRSSLSIEAVKKNIARVFDYFPFVQLSMYLFHSTILQCMANGYDDTIYTMYVALLGVPSQYYSFVKGILFTFAALLLSFVWSLVVSSLLSKKETGRITSALLLIPYDRYYLKIEDGLKRLFSK